MHERRTELVLLLLLTLTTGAVDAIGYLGFDKIFTANMTGNVVIIGMGLAGAEGLPVLRPTLALVTFMLGAALAGRILRGDSNIWSGRSTGVFAAVGFGCIFLSVFVAVTPNPSLGINGTIFTSVLSALMGAQAAAARKLKIADVTTVVITSTIVGLASESRLAGGTGKNWPRRTMAILAILIGALLGGLSLKVNEWIGTGIVGCAILIVAATGHLRRPSPNQQKN